MLCQHERNTIAARDWPLRTRASSLRAAHRCRRPALSCNPPRPPAHFSSSSSPPPRHVLRPGLPVVPPAVQVDHPHAPAAAVVALPVLRLVPAPADLVGRVVVRRRAVVLPDGEPGRDDGARHQPNAPPPADVPQDGARQPRVAQDLLVPRPQPRLHARPTRLGRLDQLARAHLGRCGRPSLAP